MRLQTSGMTLVGKRWFEVMVDDNDSVMTAIDPNTPSRTGPPLIGNLAGVVVGGCSAADCAAGAFETV